MCHVGIKFNLYPCLVALIYALREAIWGNPNLLRNFVRATRSWECSHICVHIYLTINKLRCTLTHYNNTHGEGINRLSLRLISITRFASEGDSNALVNFQSCCIYTCSLGAQMIFFSSARIKVRRSLHGRLGDSERRNCRVHSLYAAPVDNQIWNQLCKCHIAQL